ncbi:MAG: hypothetical protein GKR88_14865 [Flavobacteriaceae bacterium]|nr:MAG: hypothetical protein GKR88_14865 [Flavobacteriaceae bacterium]
MGCKQLTYKNSIFLKVVHSKNDKTASKNVLSSYRYNYQGQELDQETGKVAFQLRLYDPRINRWLTTDPAGQYHSPYMAMGNNPITRTDPDGGEDEPVYGSDGTYRGDTVEGFTGEPIIYDGDLDFSKMTADELVTAGGSFYDLTLLTSAAKSSILTHIVSRFDGNKVYDKTFDISSIEGSKIYFDRNDAGGWNSRPKSMHSSWNDRITSTGQYSYTTTVENVQSSAIVHEWYSHIIKGQGNYNHLKSHRLAYKNVINFKKLRNKTTDDYKGFNLRALQQYTKEETGRNLVDPLYRGLYNRYKNSY